MTVKRFHHQLDHSEPSPAARPGLNISYFQIEGLTCPRCASRVKMALLLTPGVLAAFVEYPYALAEVAYDPKQANADALAFAVQAAGDGRHHRYAAKPL